MCASAARRDHPSSPGQQRPRAHLLRRLPTWPCHCTRIVIDVHDLVRLARFWADPRMADRARAGARSRHRAPMRRRWPAGMTVTSFPRSGELPRRAAVGYIDDEGNCAPRSCTSRSGATETAGFHDARPTSTHCGTPSLPYGSCRSTPFVEMTRCVMACQGSHHRHDDRRPDGRRPRSHALGARRLVRPPRD